MFSGFIHVVVCICIHSLLWLDNIPLYEHYVLFIHSLVDGHLDCFHLLAIVDSAVVNIHIQAFFWTSVFNSFEVEWLSHMIILGLTYWWTAKLFSQHAHHFTFPLANVRGFQFPTFSPTLAIVCLFYSSYPNALEMVHHCGFDLHFPPD